MAITWYWGLAHLLAQSGIEIDDVYDMLSAWLAGQRQIWFMPAVDDATGIKASILVGRADDGQPLVILARVDGKDIYIVNAFRPTPELVADFERWESRRD
ncbi:hypothetical protein ACIRRA_30175 [Nocardia sp. NPDC101769]|uniref:hypothetical protein n=1 Tax=Nocardia sp. NPDC101769 TaxID=3364333 RepID=UPI0038145597